MAHAYAHLFAVPATGLRFFTVYGPWGRPDMAMWLFMEAVMLGRPIRLFNRGPDTAGLHVYRRRGRGRGSFGAVPAGGEPDMVCGCPRSRPQPSSVAPL